MSAQNQGMNRRDFLILSTAGGTALVVGCRLGTKNAPTEKRPIQEELKDTDLNAWITVEANNTIRLRINESEMGQGILTGLAVLLAEELKVPWDKIRAEHAPAHEKKLRLAVHRGQHQHAQGS